MGISKAKNAVFVFGSNEAGLHGAGAAKTAREEWGAIMGCSYGHYGKSFAIPTKDGYLEVLDLDTIQNYVIGFLAYAKGRPKLNFYVTAIGTGLAGISHREMAAMFEGASKNVYFDEVWQPILGDSVQYWGTF